MTPRARTDSLAKTVQLVVLACSIAFLISANVSAQEKTADPTPPLIDTASAQPPEEPQPEAPPVPATVAPVRAEPCSVEAPKDEARLDQYRREIFETICESAARFDRLFGDRRFDEEARRTHGRVGVRMLWDEQDGFELDGTFKVDVNFPNLDHRLNAFLGRDDTDDFVTGRNDDLDFLPTFFEREGDEEWLLGFGYNPVRGDRNRVDFDGGIEGGDKSAIDPFVRARYRHYRVVGNKNLLRARQTVYWTNDKDFGTASRVDFERPFGERTLARWSGNAVYDGLTEGADWDTGVTVYHGFSPARAVSIYLGIDGETGREVPLQNYGTSVTYRQQLFRPWFFGEVISGVSWPKDTIEQEREAALHIGFGFEIQFSGEALGLGLQRSANDSEP